MALLMASVLGVPLYFPSFTPFFHPPLCFHFMFTSKVAQTLPFLSLMILVICCLPLILLIIFQQCLCNILNFNEKYSWTHVLTHVILEACGAIRRWNFIGENQSPRPGLEDINWVILPVYSPFPDCRYKVTCCLLLLMPFSFDGLRFSNSKVK